MHTGPRYTQSIGWKMNTVASPQLQTRLQTIIASSPRLTNPNGMTVSVDNGTVFLRGNAADDHEKAIAGAILSMSPGVYDFRNELKVQAPAVTPAGSAVKQP